MGVDHKEYGRLTAGHEYQQLTSRNGLLELTNHNICEVRHYLNPPQLVKEVMGVTLQLLGYNEEDSQDWGVVLQVLSTTDKDEMVRFVERRAPRVSLQTAERARLIIADIDMHTLNAVSSAIMAFYVWSTAVISRAIVAKR